MTRTAKSAGAVLAAAAVAGLVWWLLPGDERRIRALLHEVAGELTVAAGEEALARAARAARIGQRLSPDVRIEEAGTARALDGRDDVVGVLATGFAAAGLVTVDLLELEVDVADDGLRATARAVARVSRQGRLDASPEAEDWPLELELEQVDGTWFVARVVAIETAAGPPASNQLDRANREVTHVRRQASRHEVRG
jgi:hypothetical protein